MIGDQPTVRPLRTGSVSGITKLVFNPPGLDASLVNISTTGLLAQSAAKMRVGTCLAVEFEGGFLPSSITGRVVRCEVAVMEPDGILRYHIGIEFDALLPIDTDDAEDRTAAPRPATVRNRW
jgi:hypothetical protein